MSDDPRFYHDCGDGEAARRMREGKRFHIANYGRLVTLRHGAYSLLHIEPTARTRAVLPELLKRLNARKEKA